MKKCLKLIAILALLCFVSTMVLCACGKKDDKELILGRWEKTSDSGMDYIEFFDDGTFVTEAASWCGTYSITGNRLRLTGRLNAIVFDFEFDERGDELTLTTEGGYTYYYERQGGESRSKWTY